MCIRDSPEALFITERHILPRGSHKIRVRQSHYSIATGSARRRGSGKAAWRGAPLKEDYVVKSQELAHDLYSCDEGQLWVVPRNHTKDAQVSVRRYYLENI